MVWEKCKLEANRYCYENRSSDAMFSKVELEINKDSIIYRNSLSITCKKDKADIIRDIFKKNCLGDLSHYPSDDKDELVIWSKNADPSQKIVCALKILADRQIFVDSCFPENCLQEVLQLFSRGSASPADEEKQKVLICATLLLRQFSNKNIDL